jgi:hypothetical protein
VCRQPVILPLFCFNQGAFFGRELIHRNRRDDIARGVFSFVAAQCRSINSAPRWRRFGPFDGWSLELRERSPRISSAPLFSAKAPRAPSPRYDFAGYVPGGNTQPAGWMFSAALVGITPGKVTPTDNPHLFNLTWTYTGSTQVGPESLGIFSAVAHTNLAKSGEFASEATKNSGDLAGTKVDNIGNVAVPIPEMSALMPMIGVVGFAAIGLALSYLRQRRER